MPTLNIPTPPLTVLHVASGDLWAGAEAQLFTLARSLHENQDIHLKIVLLNHGKLEQALYQAGIDVTVIDETRLGFLSLLSRLTNIVRNSSPDIIHTHRTKENILGSIAGLVAGRIPSIRTVHGAPEHKPSLKLAHKYLSALLDRLCGRFLQNAIVAVSTELVPSLKNMFPAYRIHVIENGIDHSDFDSLRTLHRKKLTIPKVTSRVGIAGRLVPIKRLDLFIQTAQYLKLHYPDNHASFHIYGDGPLLDALETLCHELHVSDIVSFEGHHDDIHVALAGLDVLMMTSDHEGTPMILLEALAIGIPVIAHDTGGISEVLNKGECGILVKDHTPKGYARELVKLLNSLSQSANTNDISIIRHLQNRFNASINAAQYLSLYREVSGKQKK